MRSPTTSSPGVSRGPEALRTPSDVVLSDYHPGESDEALEIERDSPQGSAYRLAFRRPVFHRRAELFPVHRILTARRDGRLVGVGAVALKDVVNQGRPERAAFFFDFRVRPEARGLGIGRRLGTALLAWAEPQCDLSYTYTMAGNDAATQGGMRFGADAGGYATLVLPVPLIPSVRAGPRRSGALDPAPAAEVHERMLGKTELDLYSNPLRGGVPRGTVGSWLFHAHDGLSGVSAWTARGILEEVVVSLPAPLRALRALLRAMPARARAGLRVPEDGEALRSWYLFDLFAPSPAAVRELVAAVAELARDRGIDWLYLVHAPGDPLFAGVRGPIPSILSPNVPFHLLVRRSDGSIPAPVRRLYVDVRDL